MEIWKSVVTEHRNYTGFYSVSNYGNVRNDVTKRVYKLGTNVRGYKVVFLRYYGEIKTYQVGRLVGMAFIPNPENKPQINHINSIKTDNRVENLEWVTCSENVKHNYGIRSKIDPLFNILGNNSNAKPVINTKTGEIYGCATEVARLYGHTVRAFCKRLSGESKNNTDFAYLN